MQTFGYKIIDKSRSEIAPVVNAALSQQRPLEVGLYHHDPEAWDFLHQKLAGANLPVNTHLDHYTLSLFTLARHEPQLHQQLQQALTLGSAYSVTHLNVYPTTQRTASYPALAEYLRAPLQILEKIGAEYGHPVHLENTFHTLPFYRWFFERIVEMELPHVHVCFDLGHAHIWSHETLAQWLDWLAGLQTQGKRLHFHLHVNNGLADQHLSFVETGLDSSQAPAYTGQGGYAAALASLHSRFPHSRKVFEVKPCYALANMELVMDALGVPA